MGVERVHWVGCGSKLTGGCSSVVKVPPWHSRYPTPRPLPAQPDVHGL